MESSMVMVEVELGAVDLAEQRRLGLELGSNVGGRCDDVVVEVKRVSRKGKKDEGEYEMMCRICHLSSDREKNECSELIQLGCGCKEELGLAHRDCAEAWFRIKGNRQCEICGALAENITGAEEGSFMEQWSEGRMPASAANRNYDVGRCAGSRPIFKLLIALLTITFILPWFLHSNIF